MYVIWLVVRSSCSSSAATMDTPNLLTSLPRTNLLKFSFMKRIVGEWNSLPLDIRGASSGEEVKKLRS